MTGSLDIDKIMAFQALNSQDDAGDFEYDDEEDFDDEEDYDDDEAFADYDDDEEGFGEYDDDNEMFFEADDDYDEGYGEAFPERRRRRRRRSFRRPRYRSFGRRRRLRKVRGSRRTTLRASNGQKLKVRFGKSYATSAEVNKLIRETEKKFADAVKERKANHDRLAQQITKATKTLDGKVSAVRSDVKKVKEQARTSALLGLLQGSPKVESIQFSEAVSANTPLKADVKFAKQNVLLPLLLTGGLGDSGSGGDNSMLLIALALSNK